jgi:hypothetical protein
MIPHISQLFISDSKGSSVQGNVPLNGGFIIWHIPTQTVMFKSYMKKKHQSIITGWIQNYEKSSVLWFYAKALQLENVLSSML